MKRNNLNNALRRGLIMAGAAVLLAGSADAKVARRDPHTVINSDGTQLTYIMKGNARFHQLYTLDGYPLLRDAEGNIVYAEIAADKTMRPSQRIARDAEYRTSEDKAILASQTTGQITSAIDYRRLSSPRYQSVSNTRGQGLCTTSFPSKGEQKGLVILVEFSDVHFNDYNGASYQEDPHTYFENMLNEEGFSTYGGTGSARDYFIENSRGQFTPEFDVYGPVRLTMPMKTYGGNDWWGNDQNPHMMVIEACQALDAKIDFSQYDRDNDGVIDNVYVFYAGYGEADSGKSDTVWPHSWEISQATTTRYRFDGVLLNHYACSNETDYYMRRPDGVGTFVHEFSHVMGLPDLYETTYSTGAFTPGEFSVLDYGPYNNDGRTPPNYSGYELIALDWVTPKTFGASGEYSIANLADSQEVYRVDTEVDREYYLFENRQLTGWDKYLPGHGMLVWHIDVLQSVFDENSVNNSPNHQYVDLIEADNRRTESSLKGDPFPGASNITEFSFRTTPQFKSWKGKDLGIALSNITEQDGDIVMHVENANHTGVEIIESVSGISGDLYDVNGRFIGKVNGALPEGLMPGLYIIRSAEKTVKVLI